MAAVVLPGGRLPGRANKQDNPASVIDVTSGATLAVLPTGTGPHEVATSGNGRWAVVTNYGAQIPGSSLMVIDLDSLKVARTIDLGDHRRPHGIAFDVATRQQLAAIATPPDSLRGGGRGPVGGTIGPDSRTAYIAPQGTGEVAVVDLVKLTIVGYLKTGARPDGIALARRGS